MPTSTDTETTEAKPETREQATAKRRITATREKIDVCKAKLADHTAQLNQDVAAARDARVTYRDIASVAGKSVAWVQASLKSTKDNDSA